MPANNLQTSKLKSCFPDSPRRGYDRQDSMKLKSGLHLAYCGNIHRGESWAEMFGALQNFTLAVREQVCPGRPYGIGLRLSDRAAHELSNPPVLLSFRKWLDQHQCYVFTISGFSFGGFSGERIKEQVFMPDWTSPTRLAYTNLLFDLLARLLPTGVEGSVNTVPGSFKGLVTTAEEAQVIRANLWHCVEHIARVSELTERQLHLGLEPEPFGLLENTVETVHFFDRLRAEHRNDARLDRHLGITYDTCHFAVAFEQPQAAIAALQQHGIKISKLQLGNALKVRPSPEAIDALRAFGTDNYLHQVVMRDAGGRLTRHKDLDRVLTQLFTLNPQPNDEWRIHFHIPLHSAPPPPFDNTADHVIGTLDLLKANPALCSRLEMETCPWEMLSPELKDRGVAEQLAAEYEWTLARLSERGLA